MMFRDRLRPWHGLLLLVFVCGVGVSLNRSGAIDSLDSLGSLGSLGAPELVTALASGLLGVLVFQFTVGIVWGYVVEYLDAGGSWTDAPFLVPFAVGLLATIAVLLFAPRSSSSSLLVSALSTGFWGFVAAAVVVAVVVWFLSGYREGHS